MNREKQRTRGLKGRFPEAAEPQAEAAVDLDARSDDLPGQPMFPPFLCFSLFRLRIFLGW